jgi:hypothetical protein
MNNLIYIKKSLTKELCDEIIHLFENEEKKHIGTMVGGVNLNKKNTTDFSIPIHQESCWNKINDILQTELQKHLNDYINKTKPIFKYNILKDMKYLFEDSYNIQKYKANEGFYDYHNDSFIDVYNNRYRVLTFLWYLNDVEVGGETELLDDIFIKPECGNLLLFPASWTFPHRGKIPISNDKYILTGWLCSKII